MGLLAEGDVEATGELPATSGWPEDPEQDQDCIWSEGVHGRGREVETLPYLISGPWGQQRQREVVRAKVEDLRSNYPCFYHCH